MAMDGNQPFQPGERRPIASRDSSWAPVVARRLAGWNVAPNAISASSMAFSALAGLAIVAAGASDGVAARILWLLALAAAQLRLLANLFDGMVAVENNRASPVGELYNEVPDRVSDTLILVALGFVPGSTPALALAVALLAVFVAYVRAIGAAAGAGQVFSGVMAKQHRMFMVSLLCLFHAVVPASWSTYSWLGPLGISGLALVLIGIGCAITAVTRLTAIASRLRRHD